MKIALCMIAKDKELGMIRALESTKGVFDLYVYQDTGSKDKTLEEVEKWCKARDKECITDKKYVGKDYRYVEVNEKKILGEFCTPRNESFEMARKAGADFVFWMDSDDVLVNPEHIRHHAERMRKDGVAAMIMTYNYSQQVGNLKPIVQKRERLIDLKYKGHWKNWVHETYEFKEPVKLGETDAILVQHLRDGSEVLETGRRNMLIMHDQLKEMGIESFSDQMLNNLAFDHWEHKEYDQALEFYGKLCERPIMERPDFAYQVYIKMARAHMGQANYDKAISLANKASALIPQLADAHLIFAEVFSEQEKWEDAIYYADKVIQIGKPDTAAPISEIEYVSIPRRIKINAYLKQGNIEKALNQATELTQVDGGEQAKNDMFMIQSELTTKNAIIGISNVLKFLQSNNLHRYADRLREAIPKPLLDNHIVRNLIQEMMSDCRRKSQTIKLEGSKSIVIYAGEGVIEPWDGESDVKRGIGGSEGMCIQLSRELAKLGNKVIVYNDCGDSAGKEFDGVMYEDHRKWNPDIKCDVFVSLRRPDVFQRIIKAKKQYLWLHDTGYGNVPMQTMYSPNKITALSKAHVEVLKSSHGIRDDSVFWVTRNGLNPVALKQADKEAGERNPYQVFWASSYDRGLDNALRMWPKVKEAIPEAEFKIIYGWNTFDKLMNARPDGDPHKQWMKNYKSQIVEMIANTEGVTELGKVSQVEHYKLAKESGVWFYPTEFYEISCIGAMVAQAMGAIPVCTPHAALNETVSSKYGVKTEMSNIADALIYTLKNQGKREEMMKWARKEYDMKELAKEWDDMFSNG